MIFIWFFCLFLNRMRDVSYYVFLKVLKFFLEVMVLKFIKLGELSIVNEEFL